MSYDLLRKEMAKEPLPKLEDLIETFQNYARLYPTQPTPLSTFSASLGITNSATPTCICRATHWYSECPYFNPAIRESTWIPDPSIQDQINTKLRSDPTLQNRINRSIEIGKRKAMYQPPLHTAGPSLPLPEPATAQALQPIRFDSGPPAGY
jgi:hypothetical protein